MLFFEVLGLAEADTVLAGAGTAACESVVHDFGVDLLGPLLILLVVRVHGEDGVIVAVPNVAQDSAIEAVVIHDSACLFESSGQIGDRNTDICRHGGLFGVKAPYGDAGLVAGVPQPLPSFLISFEVEGRKTLFSGGGTRLLDILFYTPLAAAKLKKQRRRFWVVSFLVKVDGFDGAPVDELDAAYPDTAVDHGDRR